MNIKVLTDERIKLLWKETRARMGCGGDPVLWFARAIEQAILQSPEVQGLRNALQEVVDAADGDGWNVLDPSLEKQRTALAAMKKHEMADAMLKEREL